MEHRHAIRRTKDGLWEVYDIDDDRVVFADGVALTNLQDDEALDALELLKGGFLVPSSAPKPADSSLADTLRSTIRKMKH
ncbi:MAG: hypothetical protein E5X83_14110 [Mesorhizobium sp.]|nr:MAG: hypothetical protein EOR57_24350 [Mesorhizobium sp.]RWM75734.1 MAG: hypothetical protein EOR82_03615 [Mesorhizobium sp.]TIO25339.1 MAG: hypothetical protein E5X83_14110 [Mesorhizobium sp.]TJV58836.1 MAG: hypothetical protein E5X82_17540 [Mesorhizobium sp.]